MQFDTLPIVCSGPPDMCPGDLVFISGIYNNPKGISTSACCVHVSEAAHVKYNGTMSIAKRQHHDIVHVEIWIGEGEKTLGARWQKGR